MKTVTTSDPVIRKNDGETPPVKIRLRGVRKSFGEKEVLKGLDLDIYEGESLVIIGGSGSGKSVLLKHIIGLLQPDEGTVEVDGVDLSSIDGQELTQFRQRYGMAFQEGALFDSMTVFENVAFPLRRRRELPREQIDKRVSHCLDLVRLEGVDDKMPGQLSGGMRRRVGFARAIAHEPKIVLFDEPTTGLDPITTALIDEVILRMLDRLGSTAITITHDMTSAFRVADRIGLLHQGEIVALEGPEAFRQHPDRRVQQFIHGKVDETPLTSPQS